MLSLLRDEEIIVAAREAATELVELDPTLELHTALATAVAARVADEQAEYLDKAGRSQQGVEAVPAGADQAVAR